MQPLLIIIDDEEDILDLLAYNFAREGFEVKTFERAGPALRFLHERKPDMILCDWMMPEMDGLELCRMVKGDLAMADIPFVMVTCRSERAAIKQALSAGVTDFIVKPVRLQELVSRVRDLLGGEQAA